MENPVLTIQCIAYNQAPYIRQCLEGFCMQKTNFRFEAIVHDDASTDDTALIIREYAEKYPDIIKPIYETENQYSKKDGSLRRIMNKHTCGKYVAYCEGDDYWTDPLKLQKQVDFLEANVDYGLIYGKERVFVQNKQKVSLSSFGRQTSSYEQLLLENTIPTLTVCFRTIYLLEFMEIKEMHNKMLGDYPLWLYIASKSKLKFANEVLGVYRKLELSASHFDSYLKQLNFIQNGVDIQLWFAEKTKLKEYFQKRILVKYSVDAFYLLLLTCKYREAYQALKYSCKGLNIFFLPFIFVQLLGYKSPLIVCGIERAKRFILNRIRYY